MDKRMKAENTQKIYLSADFPVSKFLIYWKINPLYGKIDFIPKIKGRFVNRPINREDPPRGEGKSIPIA